MHDDTTKPREQRSRRSEEGGRPPSGPEESTSEGGRGLATADVTRDRWLPGRRSAAVAATASIVAAISLLLAVAAQVVVDQGLFVDGRTGLVLRGGSGIFVALGPLSLVLAWVVLAQRAIDGCRRLLMGVGLLLVLQWITSPLLELRLRPEVLVHAYGVVGVLMLIASAALRGGSSTSWVIGIFATGAFVLVAITVTLGLIFAQAIGIPQVAYIVLSVSVTAGALWSLATTVGAASDYGVALPSAKNAGVTVAAVIGGMVTAYGLWYSFVIDPTDEDVALDVAVHAAPASGSEVSGRVVVTVRATNPNDSPVILLAAPYEVLIGTRSTGGQAIATRTPAPTHVLATATPHQSDPPSVEARTEGAEQSCVVNLSAEIDAQDGDSAPTDQQIRQACYERAFDLLPADLVTQTGPTGPTPTPAGSAPPDSGDPSVMADDHECDDWLKRRPHSELLDVQLCIRETGEVWREPLLLAAGSSAETSIIVAMPDPGDALQVFTSIVYGYANRLSSDAETVEVTNQGNCPGRLDRTLRRLAFDPATGLIGAWDPEWVQVAVGAELQQKRRRAHVCSVRHQRVIDDAQARSPLLGVHETSNQFYFGHD